APWGTRRPPACVSAPGCSLAEAHLHVLCCQRRPHVRRPPSIAPGVADRPGCQWRVRQMSADQHGHKGHDHAVTATGENRNKLIAVLVITLSVMLIQAIGAWISGSLSLLADAGHMLSDSAGVAIALLAATL